MAGGRRVTRAGRRRVVRLLPLALLAACMATENAPDVGAPFPRLTLEALEGERVALADLRDAPMLVNFWATWCAPCRSEMASLERLSRVMRGRLRVLGITVDEDLNLAREFVLGAGLTFLNLADAGKQAVDALAVRRLPETFLVGVDGRIRLRITGAREWDAPAQIALIETALTARG